MTRLDLLALTPDAVAALTNMGLVRRALREIEAGQGPALEETGDGSVTGRFPDGVVATLKPGVPIAAGLCSCTAVGACRHRVAVALAYRAWHDTRAVTPVAPQIHAWSPGDLSDETLQAAVGKRTLARARALRQRGCAIEVRSGDSVRSPEARLSTCTVQFLVPRDLAYARCDCAKGHACEHIALAVWAFREADQRVPHGAAVTVDLQPDFAMDTARDPLDESLAFTREVLLQGTTHLTPAITARLARARTRLDAARMTWPGTILDDVEEQLGAYRDRSARYSASTLARLLGELAARRMATEHAADLPPRHVLGIGEARETLLGHVRLISLGARVYGAGDERWVEIYLADPVAGVVLVLSKAWNFRTLRENPEDGPALANRSVLPGVSLDALASGHVVTRAARRGANHALRLGSARRDALSVTTQTREWETLPEGILIRHAARHAALLKARPPRWLRPRVLAESLHVVEIAGVAGVVYAPGAQSLVATIVDPHGVPLRLVLRHRSVAPYALEALASALVATPTPRYVSGALYIGDAGLEMIPVGIFTDRPIVPDLQAGMPVNLTPGDVDLHETPLGAAVAEAWNALVDAAHGGLLYPTSWLNRLIRATEQCQSIGFYEMAERLERVATTARRLSSGGMATDTDMRTAATAWERAALRVALTREWL